MSVGISLRSREKKEEIWLSPMTKASSPAEKSKKQRDNTKTPQQFQLHNDCGPPFDGQLQSAATQQVRLNRCTRPQPSN